MVLLHKSCKIGNSRRLMSNSNVQYMLAEEVVRRLDEEGLIKRLYDRGTIVRRIKRHVESIWGNPVEVDALTYRQYRQKYNERD